MNITHIGISPAEGGWMVVNNNRRGVAAALNWNVLTASRQFQALIYACLTAPRQTISDHYWSNVIVLPLAKDCPSTLSAMLCMLLGTIISWKSNHLDSALQATQLR
jgi:hypothetical protein